MSAELGARLFQCMEVGGQQFSRVIDRVGIVGAEFAEKGFGLGIFALFL